MKAHGLLEAALAYAERGWPVLPVAPGDKGPWTKHGVKDATTDQVQIRARWLATPGANVGVRTGSGLLVLDFDSAVPPAIGTILHRLRVPVVQTGRGVHAYFASADEVKTRKTQLDGIEVEVRAEGGYVVAPPSRHPSGGIYAWVREAGQRPLPHIDQFAAALADSGFASAASAFVPISALPAASTALAGIGTQRQPGREARTLLAAMPEPGSAWGEWKNWFHQIVRNEDLAIVQARALGINADSLGPCHCPLHLPDRRRSASLYRADNGEIVFCCFHVPDPKNPDVYLLPALRYKLRDLPKTELPLARLGLLHAAGLVTPALDHLPSLDTGRGGIRRARLEATRQEIETLFGLHWLINPGKPLAISRRYLARKRSIPELLAASHLRSLERHGVIHRAEPLPSKNGHRRTLTYLPGPVVLADPISERGEVA